MKLRAPVLLKGDELIKFIIEDDEGNRIECQEVKTLNVPDSILVFQTMKRLREKDINAFCEDMKKRTGHNCILLEAGIDLVAQIAPAVEDKER